MAFENGHPAEVYVLASRASGPPVPYRGQTEFSTGERLGLGVLSATALVGIGYGVGCSLGLVGNWSLFQAGIERLLQ